MREKFNSKDVNLLQNSWQGERSGARGGTTRRHRGRGASLPEAERPGHPVLQSWKDVTINTDYLSVVHPLSTHRGEPRVPQEGVGSSNELLDCIPDTMDSFLR